MAPLCTLVEKSTFTPQHALLQKHLRALRKAAGLTHRDLAKRLGRERSLIFYVERGQRRLDLIEWIWYCRACGASPEKVVGALLTKLVEMEKKPSRRQRTQK